MLLPLRMHGILVGIDFGLKRTGIAVTDSGQVIASPHSTIASEQLMPWLVTLHQKSPLAGIVIGYPLSLNGEPTHITENVRLLKIAIERELPGLSVVLQDERYSSKRASNAIHQMGKKKLNKDKGLVDKVSAAIILQDYLNARENS